MTANSSRFFDELSKLMTNATGAAQGVRKEVDGEGVVGQQPELEPGESFEYTSHVPLETSWGTMEGWYTFTDAQGHTSRATIARFVLTPSRQQQARSALPFAKLNQTDS